jgi:hypothetical protein
MSLRAALKTLTSLMWDEREWFPEEEALVRGSWENPASARRLYDFGVVMNWVVGKDGKFEAILAVGLGMTGTCGTACPI